MKNKLTNFGFFWSSLSRKPYKIVEIRRHTTESSQHNPLKKKIILKLDEKYKFYIPFKYAKFWNLGLARSCLK